MPSHDRPNRSGVDSRARNDHLSHTAEQELASDRIAFLCECSDPSCTATVELSAAEYATVRSHPGQFLVLPGHERPADERVVARSTHFVIVEREVA